MSYYHNRIVKKGFEDMISAVTEALKNEGFGVLTQINIAEKLKENGGHCESGSRRYCRRGERET